MGMVTIGTQIPWESDGYGNRFYGSPTGMEQLSQAFHAEMKTIFYCNAAVAVPAGAKNLLGTSFESCFHPVTM